MKLLFDQNLSHKLPARLADVFPGSVHVRKEQLDQATDEAIWDFARIHGFAIVTQDADFVERSRLFGSPPKVVWLRCGNTKPGNVELLLRASVDVIVDLGRNPEAHSIELLQASRP